MNDIIYQELINLSLTQDNAFKAKAFKNAAKVVKKINKDIVSIDDVKGVKGIGKSTIEKIAIILDTGGLPESASQNSKNLFIQELTQIYGVGIKKAKELVKVISSFEELESNKDELLNAKQLIGLKHYKDLLLRIPRNEMDSHNKIITKIWANNKFSKTFEIVGSYRRNKMDSGDIDILVTFPKNSPKQFKLLIQQLVDANYLVDNLAWGPKKYMGVCRLENGLSRRIDIIYCSKEEYPFCLLYFTGSGEYNRSMREHANILGFKLNEKSLEKTDETKAKIVFKTEKEIFDFLKIPYLEPQDRTVFKM